MNLDGQIVLITGASGGIGHAISGRLAAGGATVALGYSRNQTTAETLAATITAAGGHAVAVAADLAHPHGPRDLVRAVEQRLGPVDVLVSNAGAGTPQAFDAIGLDELDATLAVNLRAPFLLAQQIVPGMRARRRGRLLFVSSVAAFTGGAVGAHHAASKAGLHGLTHYLAPLLAADGIIVNALAPALIADTGLLPGDPGQLAARIPVGRLGRPEEVAELAAAVVTNDYLTNQVVSLDGGMYPR